MTHTGTVQRATVYHAPQPDHVEIHYTDVPPPRQAYHLLMVLVDDAPMTLLGQTRNNIPTAPPGAPIGPTTALLPQTPVLDSLASKGVTFKRVRVNPECSPTRATIGTGKYAFRHGIANVVNLNASQAGDLAEFGDTGYSHPTLFNALEAAGVRTAHVGKLHMSADYNQNYLGRDGAGWAILDKWAAANTFTSTSLRNLNQTSGDLITNAQIQNDTAGYYYWALNRTRANHSEELITEYNTTQLIDEAIGWWNTVDNAVPAFMWLALNGVHTPLGGRAPNTGKDFPPESLVNTEEYITLRDAEAAALSDGDAPLSFWEDQCAALEAIDTELGRFLESIPQAVRDKLAICFLSDNGVDSVSIPACREDLVPGSGYWNKDFGENWNYVIDNGRMKGSPYHFGTWVEMLWSGPGLFTAEMLRKGQVVDYCVDAPDIGETIAQFFGTTLAPTDGISFFDALYTDETIDYRTGPRQWQYTETFNPNGDWTDLMAGPAAGQELRQAMGAWYFTAVGGAPLGFYSLIRSRESGAWTYELFHHYSDTYAEVDPYERTDLSGDATYAGILADLEAQIDALLNSGSSTGTAIEILQEDGVTTKLVQTELVSGDNAIPILQEDGATKKYVLPGSNGTIVGMPVLDSDTGSGDKVVPYVGAEETANWALRIDISSITLGPFDKFVLLDQSDSLPIHYGGSVYKVVASTPGTPNTITVVNSDTGSGDKVLNLETYP